MAGGSQGGGDEEIITAINVTPLVDIVLVLLIILMVTASYIASKTIPVDLPAAGSGETTQTMLAITIDQHGALYLDATPLSESTLRSRIHDAYAHNHDIRAVIAADGRVTHAHVVRVIDLLRREHVTKFAINVRPEDLR